MGLRLSIEQRVGLLLGALIVAVAYAGFALPDDALPRLAIIGPITYFVAILGDAGTALVLIATWRSSPARRSTLVLALSFALSAIMISIAILILPLLALEPPVIESPAQAGIWVFMAFHINAAAGALAYVWLRRSDSPAMPSRRFVTLSLVIVGAIFALEICVAFVFSAHLPALGHRNVTGGAANRRASVR